MCGICGVFGDNGRETVEAMATALAHRGPDERGFVSGETFALGATRLSIVDHGGGRQPVANERRTVWVAHNGEIYNRRVLAADLRASGHDLHGDGDTALLPHLYEEFGCGMASRADGMFAFAVWDDEQRRGLLVRDRAGKKPLYYLERDGCLYFASEIKALLRVPGFERRLNADALRQFLGYKHVPHPQTIFEGIRCLPPAHVLEFSPGRAPRLSRYWAPDFTPFDTALPDAELADELERLLRQAVRRRLDADVPVGCFLSGGIDSSLTTAFAADVHGPGLQTFTLAYADGSSTPHKDQDRRWARWVAERYGTDHHEETIDEHAFPRDLPRIVSSFDEPFSGVVSTYFLSRLAARHVKTVIAGDGADELLGSYLSHRLAAARDVNEVDAAWRSALLVFSDTETTHLLAPDLAHAAGVSARERLEQDFAGLTAVDSLNRVLEAEFRSIFPDQVLAFVDRLSMAHSLEVRTPFLDTEVIAFLARVPAAAKMRDGVTKSLLKRVADRYFPSEMVTRPKEGFVLPVQRWFLNGLTPYVRDTLSPASLAAHGLFETATVTRLVDDYYGGRHEHAQKLLALVTFQEWHRLYRPCLPA